MNWETTHTGDIWIVEQSVRPRGVRYEVARRSPGVRALIVDEGRLLLNKERRHELFGKLDYRLPGGVVYDDQLTWLNSRYHEELVTQDAALACAVEVHEETGLIVDVDSVPLAVDILGSKVEWDLYYFLATPEYIDDDHQLGGEEASSIKGYEWFTPSQALDIALHHMAESRSSRYVALWAHDKLDADEYSSTSQQVPDPKQRGPSTAAKTQRNSA